jgi:uncharacterized membrane protein YgcG
MTIPRITKWKPKLSWHRCRGMGWDVVFWGIYTLQTSGYMLPYPYNPLRILEGTSGDAMNRLRLIVWAATSVALCGCAMSSDVMDAGNGTYMISAHAAPIRGGATEADSVAYQDANRFCARKTPGTHAIVVDSRERDVYQGSFGGSGGSFGGGVFASGNANLRFRCGL